MLDINLYQNNCLLQIFVNSVHPDKDYLNWLLNWNQFVILKVFFKAKLGTCFIWEAKNLILM